MKPIKENYFIKKEGVNFDPSIESLVGEDEKILWKGKPYRKSFILNAFFKMFFIILIWLLFDAAFMTVLFVFVPSIPWWMILIVCIFFLFHLLPVWIWITNIVTASRRQKLEEYAFTDKRIIIKKGLIGANLQSINYSSITSVNIRIGLIERLCKVGDIYIASENQGAVLEDIQDPYFIYDRLQKIANDIKADILYPNVLRPKENPGYKTSYRMEDDFLNRDKKL